MKKVLIYNGFLILAFLLLWTVLVVVEVKVRQFWFLEFTYFASLLLALLTFPLVNFAAFNSRPKIAGIMAFLSMVVLAPAFIYAGVIFVWELKIALGGSK